ncbi:MAG: DUF1501 domain-containing protein [Pirellulaceae bacterium]
MTTSFNTTRRDFLRDATFGVAGIAVMDLPLRDGKLQAAPQTAAGLHHSPRAKNVIHIFLGGGLSHIDSFDYKPELVKYHDKELPESFGKADAFMGKAGRLHRSHYVFKQRGKSGLWMSELFPQLNEVADELTLINSMVAETANHIPGIFQANTGFRQMGFPAMGSWLSCGLGSDNDNLPSFVVLPDIRGIPNSAGGAFNWTSGFLPAEHQGVPFNTRGGPPILDLQPASGLDTDTQRERLELLGQLNAMHLDEHVQTVQLWTGDGVSWDAHGDITGNGYKSHTGEALRVDRPVAGLIRDLRQRGLLDSTVVMITTEFGRTPYTQADRGKLSKGRDHHPEGFTNVLAGGGLKPGFAYGATDDVGYTSIVNPVTTYDLHATVLHLLGINHERLTFYHNGIQRRLTNVHGQVIKDVLS